jgi:Stress responsive A/B Barrel Domain
MAFADAEARDAYLPHPEHEKVEISVFVEGRSEGVLALDLAS